MAQVVVELTGDEAKLLKSMQNIIEKNIKTKESLRQIGTAGKEAGTNIVNGMSASGGSIDKVQSSITKLKAGFGGLVGDLGGVSTVIAQVTKAWQLYIEAQKEALNSQSGLADTNRRLVQIADSPEDLRSLQVRADRASLATGVDRNVSREVLFSARSEGFEQEFEKLIAANQVIDPKAAAVVAGKIPALFQGKIKPVEAMSLALRAAKESNLSFEQLSTGLPTAAEGGSLVGASPEELFAVQSVMASRFKSGDTAADRNKAFASAAGIDPRLSGKGIIGAYEAIKAMTDDERTDYLGKNQELNAAYVILGEEMPKIKRQKAILEKEREDFAKGGGMLRAQMDLVKSDDGLQNQVAVRQSRVDKEIATEQSLATTGGINERASNQTQALMNRKGGNLLNRLYTWQADTLTSVVASGSNPDQRAMINNIAGDVLSLNVFATLSALKRKADEDSALMKEQNKVLLESLKSQQETAKILGGSTQSNPAANPALINAQTTVNK